MKHSAVLTSRVAILAINCVVWLTYCVIFAGWSQTDAGLIGGDIAYSAARLSSGAQWFYANGLAALPWFSPDFCGGFVFFAHPHSFYLAPSQFISFWVDPLTAILWSSCGLALLGQLGMYLLLRNVLGCSRLLASTGAILFLFNGFFSARMLVGHLTFQGYMLVPFAMHALAIGTAGRSAVGLKNSLARGDVGSVVLTAVVMTCVFLMGGVHLLLPIALLLFAWVLMLSLTGASLPRLFLRLVTGGVLCCLLSAFKLFPALSVLAVLPRDDYALPGFWSWKFELLSVVKALLWYPDASTGEYMRGFHWGHAQEIWEYSLGPAPLLLLGAAVASALFQRLRIGQGVVLRRWWQLRRAQWLVCCILLLVLVLPLLLNYYSESWHALLAQLPVIRNSSILVRWFCFYIPLLLVFSVAVFRSQCGRAAGHSIVCFLALAVTLSFWLGADRSYYQQRVFLDPGPLLALHKQACDEGTVTPVVGIGEDSRVVMPEVTFDSNSLMREGLSLRRCYEPLLGYHLQHLRLENTSAGSARQLVDGYFNMKNPACYLYPDENDCLPGDNFASHQHADLEAFLSRKPFAWQSSAGHDWVIAISGLAWLGVLLWGVFLLWQGVGLRVRKGKG